jgi:hypothetical protein
MAPIRSNQKKGTAKKSNKQATAANNTSISSRVLKPKIPNEKAYDMRRILAERLADNKTYYLVDWYPSWQPEKNTSSRMVREWNNNKKEHTFDFDGDIKLNSTNPTQDDAEGQVSLMIQNVAKQFQKHLGITSGCYVDTPSVVAARLIIEDDWKFARPQDKEEAIRATRPNEDIPSAAEVMRRTYAQMRRSRRDTWENSDVDFGGVRLTFVGQVDPQIKLSKRQEAGLPRASPRVFLQPLFDSSFLTMQPAKWAEATMHAEVAPLLAALENAARFSPFLLTQPWPLFFTRMFIGGAELETLLLEHMGVVQLEDWTERSRNEFLYTYVRDMAHWEKRTIDQMQATYLCCRSWIREHMEPVDEEEQEDALRKAAHVEERASTDDMGIEDEDGMTE